MARCLLVARVMKTLALALAASLALLSGCDECAAPSPCPRGGWIQQCCPGLVGTLIEQRDSCYFQHSDGTRNGGCDLMDCSAGRVVANRWCSQN